MPDQQEPVEAERPPEQATASEQSGESRAESPPEQQPDAQAPPRAPSGWPGLDSYCEELRVEQTDWAERLDAVETQLLSLRATLAGIAAQHHALGIDEDLELINERVLGGVAMAQSVRIGHNLERYTALLWPAAGDPRSSMVRDDDDAEYRVEIWMHLGPDGKGRIRIEGEKRLEAMLPTSRERVRSVLIRAVQSPKLVSKGEVQASESEAPQPSAEQPPVEQPPVEQPSAERPEQQPVEEATPRPGDPQDQPPPDEQVIPLGPSEDAAPRSSEDKPDAQGP